MKIARIKSYAKINLALNITGKKLRLHKIESIVSFINLYDDIFIKEIKSKTNKVLFEGPFSRGISKNNTISKLFQILEKRKLLRGKKFYIKVYKRIPFKAGLGGGSMNAASLLRYFSQKNFINPKKEEIMNISNLIGSDVKLGLKLSNSILNSNDRIRYFKNCKKINLLIVKPNFGCSTKEIFSKVKKFNNLKYNNPKKKMFDLKYLKKTANSLEPIVLSKYPKLRLLKSYLESLSNIVFVRMTGSGSAMVGYFTSQKSCIDAKKKVSKKYKNYWCLASKTI